MTDILVRNIGPDLAKRLKDSARRNRRSLSDEAKALMKRGLVTSQSSAKMGDFLFSLVEKHHRGDDLVFERDEPVVLPPTFE